MRFLKVFQSLHGIGLSSSSLAVFQQSTCLIYPLNGIVTPIKHVAVNESSPLKSNSFDPASQLYDLGHKIYFFTPQFPSLSTEG